MGKTKGRLRKKMLCITIIPLVLTGIAILFATYFTFSGTVQKEVQRGLSNMAITTLRVYDKLYPGDYGLVEENGYYYFYKGDNNLSTDDNYLQEIKRDTGIDITFFLGEVRVLTTLGEMNGKSMIGTSAHPSVVKDVLEGEQETFYKSVLVGSEEYFAFYFPVYNGTGSLVGMIFAGKPASEVQKEIWTAMMPTFIVVSIMVVISCVICTSFTKELVMVITRVKSFLREIAQGNLKAELDSRIMQRDDELGEMGRFTVHVQKALREMIEKDMLTKLYSRRIGEIRLRQVQQAAAEDGSRFCVALADIDFFKKFNDTYGHDCGDLVLKEVAAVLAKNMMGKGFAIRWGGEEFLLVYEHCDLTKALEYLEKLREQILVCEVLYNEEVLHVTMTYGIVEGRSEEAIEMSVKEADDLLYLGKTNGRNQIVSVPIEKT